MPGRDRIVHVNGVDLCVETFGDPANRRSYLSWVRAAGSPDLPPMSEELRAFLAEPPPEPDWSDRAAVVDYWVDSERPFAGSRLFDEAGVRDLARRVFDRTVNMESTMTNHWLIDGGDPIRRRLGQVTAPTLVIHGTEDPLFPYGHAEALAAEIPRARLLAMERTGHEVPRAVWDVVVPAIVQHTSRGQPTR